jgi:replicative DNA helicase
VSRNGQVIGLHDRSSREGRVPPHNVQAEEGLLGAMLLSKDAVGVGLDQLTAEAFYKPSHGHIFDCMRRLHHGGEPVDPVTVADMLRRDGLLDDIGGPQVLVAIQAGTPSTGNARRYARIVSDHYLLRRMIGMAGAIAELGYDLPEDVGEALGTVEGLFKQLEDLKRVELPDGYSTLDAFLRQAEEEGEDFAPDLIPGIIKREHRCVIIGMPGSGKGLALDTPIPTPTGWTTMGALQAGAEILGGDGWPCKVLGTSGINHRPCYRVTLSDGAVLIADDQHRWAVTERPQRRTGSAGRSIVVDTPTLRKNLRCADGVLNYAIEVVESSLPEADLPIDPYVLGAWLGDGNSRMSLMHSQDDEIRDEFTRRGYTVHPIARGGGWRFESRDWHRALDAGLVLVRDGWTIRSAAKQAGCDYGTLTSRCRAEGIEILPKQWAGRKFWRGPVTPLVEKTQTMLRSIGLWRNKHIPAAYLRASVQQRFALLAGIVDTDGHIDAAGHCDVTLCNERLANDVAEVARTLGYKTTINESDAQLDGRVVGRRWRVLFTPDRRLPVVVPRKLTRLRSDIAVGRYRWRYVTAVEPVEPVPTKCIVVDSSDHTFLAGRDLVKTHNSMLLHQIAVAAAGGVHPFNGSLLERPLSTLIVDAENPRERVEAGARPLRDAALENQVWEEENCHLWRCPAGIDLTRHRYQSELEAVVRDACPDLVVIGPAYKLAPMRGADANDVVARVMDFLDHLRMDYGFALMIETHPPRGDGPMRAFGSAQWEMWPELSFTLEKVEIDSMPVDGPACFEIGNARTPRVEHSWPKVIRHRRSDARGARQDGPWPWVVVESEDPEAF